jgi:N-acetylneuraminate lyase
MMEKQMKTKFTGIIPALVTPFDKKDRVDLPAFRKLIDRLIELKVGGLFVCGTTGEWWALTQEERMQLTEAAVEAAAGRVKVMISVGCNSTAHAIQLAKHAATAGADAISALPPVARPFSSKLIWDHFKAIGESCPLPLYLYHLPQVYGDLITVDKFLDAMETMPTLSGAKFSSYRIDDMIYLKARAKGRLNIISGCGEQLLSAMINGADGSICTWFNVLPRLGNRIIECLRAKKLDEAARLQEIMVLFGVRCVANNTGNAKWLLAENGLPVGAPRLPMVLPDKAEQAVLRKYLKEIGADEWVL